MRAQRGTMECISRTLCALSSEADKAGGAIDSATGDGGGDDGDSGDSDGGTISAAACSAFCSALAARVCNLLDITATSMQAVAVVSTAVRMLHTRGGAPHAAPLARVLLPMLLGHEGAVVTQCLFDVTFHAQPLLPQPLLRRLLERARTDATSESDDTRLGALKLLGVCFSALDPAAADAHEVLRPCVEVLHALGTDDASTAVRSLAQQLAATAFGGH